MAQLQHLTRLLMFLSCTQISLAVEDKPPPDKSIGIVRQCFQEICEHKEASVENLGESLIEDGCEPVLNENLGDSLIEADDNLGISLSSLNHTDNLGSSLIDNIDDSVTIPNILQEEMSSWTGKEFKQTSTPKKDGVDQYSKVYATPAMPKSTERLILAEVSPRRNKLYSKAMNRKEMKSALRKNCFCGGECKKTLTLKTLATLRYRFWSMSRQSRSQWLIHSFANAEIRGRHRIHQIENRQKFCSVAFRQVYKINKNYYGKCKKLQERNSVSTSGAAPRITSIQSLSAIAWLEDYASFYGDRMPHCKDILLPYKTLKQNVYAQYRADRVADANSVSRTQFYRLWKSHLPQVKIKRTNTFSKCTVCTSLEKQLEKTLCASTRAELIKLRHMHNQRQMWERKYYYSKREQSRRMPSKYLSLIIDGMDQSKTSLPHFTGRRAKNINPSDLLKTHITGVINHGLDHFNTYVDFNQIPHDPNLTINILLQSLEKSAKELGDKLPCTLYIQADNCWRENKNRYVLSFCELLVAKNIFKEVHLSFLYVGHTHEDVDAAFSRISEKLRVTDIATFEELLHMLPKAEALKNLYDVKAWLDPHLSQCTQQTQPLHYKFEASDAGVRTSFKGNHMDEWIALDGNFLQTIPRGQPRKLNPDFQKIDVDRNMKQVRAIQHMFRTPTEIHAWWEEFYLTMNKETTGSHWILDRLPKQSKSSPTVQAEPLPEVITNMLDKEVRVPQVRIRKKPQTRDTGRGTKKLKKSAQKQNSGKTKGKRHRRYVLTVTITTLCLLEGDLKKHIWLIIFWTLIENFIQNVFFLYIQILYCWKELFQLLLLAGNLVLMKFITDVIWKKIIAVHMGLFAAMVSVVTMTSASHFYAPNFVEVEGAYSFWPVHL